MPGRKNGRDEMRESSKKNSEGLASLLSTHVSFVPLHCLLSNNRFLKVILLNDGVERESSCQCFTNVNWLLMDLYFCTFLFLLMFMFTKWFSQQLSPNLN